jgi:hypothetical protein
MFKTVEKRPEGRWINYFEDENKVKQIALYGPGIIGKGYIIVKGVYKCVFNGSRLEFEEWINGKTEKK